jgi:hypothetical protein
MGSFVLSKTDFSHRVLCNTFRVTVILDNVKMDFREIGWDGMDWIDMAQDRISVGLL